MDRPLFLASELDAVDARLDQPGSPELFDFLELPGYIRQLWEAEEFRVTLRRLESGRIYVSRVVRKRHPAYINSFEAPPKEDDDPPPSEEDAMALIGGVVTPDGDIVETDREESPPPDIWDLEYAVWRTPEGKWECYSADHFPAPRSFQYSDYFRVLERKVLEGIPGPMLYRAVETALKDNRLSAREAKRLWELWRIEKFLQSSQKQEDSAEDPP